MAKWSDPSSDALLRQGEKMLKEQEALDERRLFDKSIELRAHPVASNARTGTNTMRKHVAANIKNRMEEERNRDPEYNLDRQQTDQRGITIRKELNLMANARRDLTVFRKEVQAKWEEEAANMVLPEHGAALDRQQKLRRSLAPSMQQGSEQPEQSSPSAGATRASAMAGVSEGHRSKPKGRTYAPRFPKTPEAMPSTCTAD